MDEFCWGRHGWPLEDSKRYTCPVDCSSNLSTGLLSSLPLLCWTESFVRSLQSVTPCGYLCCSVSGSGEEEGEKSRNST
jgi:hypothetical protein